MAVIFVNILNISSRNEFRLWLMENSTKMKECYILLKRGKPINDDYFYYIDAVEEALCFGWIDSIVININGKIYQKFSPRKKNSPWTELNKERVRRLEKLGLMTPSGRKVLPKMGKRSFKIDIDIINALKKARVYSKFKSFHPLYQRVRCYNISFYKKNKELYEKALNHLIKLTKDGIMYGQWNDYGRLLNY